MYASDFQDADAFYEANDQMNFNASQILLLVIGEESKKITPALKEEHASIPWHLIANLRNRIAYDYRSIDPNISFDIIENYLPELKGELIDMLHKVQFEQELLIQAVHSPHYKHLKYLIEEE